MSSFDATKLGGGIQGLSVRQTNNSKRTSENVIDRRVVSRSWNAAYAAGNVNGYSPKMGPFRLVNNLGDYLSRDSYVCGGSRQTQHKRGGSMLFNCDATKVPSSTTNCKFVSDSSDYTKFKRQNQANRLYNDNSL